MDGIAPVGSPAFWYTPLPTTPGVALAGPSSPADQVILSSASQYAALDTLGATALYGAGQTATPAAAPAAVQMDWAQATSQAQLATSLLGASTPTDPSMGGLFAASSTLSLVDAQGAAALSYLTPATPPLGTTIDALA